MGAYSERFVAHLSSRQPVCLDSCVLIYHLEGLEPYAGLTTALLIAAAKGEVPCLVSTVAAEEILVRPFQSREEAKIGILDAFLLGTPGLELVPLDYEIARTAARLRASHRLRTADALLVATGIVRGAGAFLSNDAALKRQLAEEIEVVILDDFTRSHRVRERPKRPHR